MMEEEEDAVSNINFISCVQFIKQGVAKEKPDKVSDDSSGNCMFISEFVSS